MASSQLTELNRRRLIPQNLSEALEDVCMEEEEAVTSERIIQQNEYSWEMNN